MAFDLLIKNGMVIDGSGLPRVRANVAIQDGRIAEIGVVDGPARRVIDADGRVVAPGIVDPHTHYDAQVTWDRLATSSCLHGVTTVVAGNCGYTIAPCRPADRDWLTKTFAAVEGVDLPALEAGLPWTWETYPEYLDTLDRGLGINFAGYVGHTAVRRYVMGEAACERAATEDELRAMQEVIRQSMAAGAAGFSTSRSATQVGYYNEPIPSRLATDEEVLLLARTAAEFNVGNIAYLPSSNVSGISPEDAERLVQLARATGRPIIIQGRSPEVAFAAGDRAGVAIYAFQNARPFDRPFTLKRTSIFNGLPTWRAVLALPHAEKIARLQQEETRAGLRYDVEHPNTDPAKGQVLQPVPWHTVYVQKVVRPENKPYEGLSLTELAARKGVHLADAFIDLALSEDLETQFRYLNVWSEAEVQAIYKALCDPHTLVGTSDGGAHLDRDDGAEYSTFFLRYWALDHAYFTLEEAIRKLTFVPASVVGLHDRGLLRPGYAADIMIFDPATLRLVGKDLRPDLPAGGLRFVAVPAGIDLTIVNGEVVVENGQATEARPGRVLRCYRTNRAYAGVA